MHCKEYTLNVARAILVASLKFPMHGGLLSIAINEHMQFIV